MSEQINAPEIFKNLIEANADAKNYGERLELDLNQEQGKPFQSFNASGSIETMDYAQISERAKTFGQRFKAASM